MSSLRRAAIAGPVLLSLALAGSACGGHRPARALSPNAGEPRVVLVPGDQLDIKFFGVPELNETQRIRRDGRISLQLVGEVVAAGKTPGELQADLASVYAPHLKTPQVSVIIREEYGNRIFVGGEVNQPGMIEMPGRLTALEAIMNAGGFNMRSARVKKVVLIRQGRDGQLRGTLLDFRGILEGQPTGAPELQPFDVLWVPRTSIAKVDQWIDQHINKLVPQFGFIYTRRLGNSTVGIDTSTGRGRP